MSPLRAWRRIFRCSASVERPCRAARRFKRAIRSSSKLRTCRFPPDFEGFSFLDPPKHFGWRQHLNSKCRGHVAEIPLVECHNQKSSINLAIGIDDWCNRSSEGIDDRNALDLPTMTHVFGI
jgi:hypothetical protein